MPFSLREELKKRNEIRRKQREEESKLRAVTKCIEDMVKYIAREEDKKLREERAIARKAEQERADARRAQNEVAACMERMLREVEKEEVAAARGTTKKRPFLSHFIYIYMYIYQNDHHFTKTGSGRRLGWERLTPSDVLRKTGAAQCVERLVRILERREQVRKMPFLKCHFYTENPTFYQDRLGTSIGNVETRAAGGAGGGYA